MFQRQDPKPVNDGCCEGDCGREDLRAPVVSGRHAPPVLEPAEHDLDPIVPSLSALVVSYGRFALFSTGDTGAYPFVFQRVAEPICVLATTREQPVDVKQAAEQSALAEVVADLTRCDGQVEWWPWLSQMASSSVFMPLFVRPLRRPRPPF